MNKVTEYAEVTSAKEDSFLDSLDLSEDTIDELKEVMNSIARKAYEQGFEDGEEEAQE